MSYISIVPYNRELLIIKNMEVFANFFCYAKKQKKGVVSISHAVHAAVDLDDIDERQLAGVDVASGLLPEKSQGSRRL